MRWAGRRVAVYAHGAPTDMRKGFDSLCGMVTERLARNPLSGDVFLFVSRDRIRAKVLHFDGTGLCLYVKRLERGRFAALWRDEGAEPVTLTVSELDLFLDGLAGSSAQRHRRLVRSCTVTRLVGRVRDAAANSSVGSNWHGSGPPTLPSLSD